MNHIGMDEPEYDSTIADKAFAELVNQEMYEALKECIEDIGFNIEKYHPGLDPNKYSTIMKAESALAAASPSIHVKKEDNGK